MHSTQAVINLSNLKYNVMQIRKRIRDVKLMAVVKADAYGHGVTEVVKHFKKLGRFKPDYYGVAFPDEAVELRKENINDPLLVFGPFTNSNAETCIRYNLTATVFSENHIKILLSALKTDSRKLIKVHVKVDTGMNRLGIDHKEAFNFIIRLSKNKKFLIEGIYTHFASADSDNNFTMLQLKRFKKLVNQLKQAGVSPGLLHAANSAAVFKFPESHFDMVRCGISLYGYMPSPQMKQAKLKPVMSIISEVSSVKEISAGESVSYGRRFTAKRKIKIASVPVGYADGFRRGLTNRSFGIIKGKKFRQAGTVTMDRIMLDVGNADIKTGDKVILLGKDKNESITAWDWSKALDTIPYEITCGITKRLPRIYIQ
jgi:alanine racemase